MANKLSEERKVAAVGMLCEGNSIRSVERVPGIHRDTVMRRGALAAFAEIAQDLRN